MMKWRLCGAALLCCKAWSHIYNNIDIINNLILTYNNF
jgi:hypothetical protein